MTAGRDRVLLLVNPVSGKGRGARDADPLAATLRSLGMETDLVMLEGKGAAADKISSLGGDYSIVAAAGGDGTAAEAAGAVYRAGLDTPLAVIPWGLSNCLARHYGLSGDIDIAAQTIGGGRETAVDLALTDDETALSFIGAGFDAAVARRVARERIGTISNFDYLRAVRKVLAEETLPDLAVAVDGRPVAGRFMLVICSAVDNYARYFTLSVDRGFTAFLFQGEGLADIIRLLGRTGLERNLDKAAAVRLPVAESIVVEGEAFYQCDGEAGKSLPLRAGIARQAVRLLIRPARCQYS